MRLPLVLAAMLIVTPVPAADEEFDVQFRCPQKLLSDADREVAMSQFEQWIADEHPEADTVEKVLDLRVGLLKRHHCAVLTKALSK